MSRLLIGLFMIVLLGSGCKTGTETNTNDCGTSKRVNLYKTIHVFDSTGQSEFFELETPDARNDCEATYQFYFRFADPLVRAIRNDMPPLDNLSEAFRPLGEFTYFPHPLA